MLQQTRVETVIPYFMRFLAAFPDVHTLASAPPDDVLRLWAGLGYYSRARSLHAAARRIAGELEGAIPSDVASLVQLPGVGRYTAAAIASIAFGAHAAVLDGNVKRVLSRLLAIDANIRSPVVVKQLWQAAEVLLSPRRPGDFNQAMMELGATVCTPSSPRCVSCPLARHCAARRRGLENKLPIVARRKASPIVHVVAGAILRNGALLMVQRPPRGLLGGMWELPGCEAPPHADATTLLRSALEADFGVRATVQRRIGEIKHAFTHRILRLAVFECTTESHATNLRRHTTARWIGQADWDSIALASVDKKAVALVPSPQPSA